MLSIHTAYTIANGRDWFGLKTHACPVYVLQTEIPQAQLRTRVIKYTIGNKVTSDKVWFATEHYLKLDKGYGISELEKEIIRTQPGLLIVDPLYKIVSGKMTDDYDMRQFLDRMDMLMAKYGFALILIHHERKRQVFGGQVVDMGADDMFATSIFIDWADSAVRSSIKADNEILLTIEKARYAEREMKPISVKIDRNNLNFTRM